MKIYPKEMSELLLTRARIGKPTTEEDVKFNKELSEACSSGVTLKAWLYANKDYCLVNGSIKKKDYSKPNPGLLAF